MKTYLHYLVALAAAGYDFENPIQWASGTRNPMYVDNRIGISNPESRAVLRKELPSLVDNLQEIDYVFGIPKAGIAPATLLALEIGKPLLIKNDGDYYCIDLKKIADSIKNAPKNIFTNAGIIAATVPFGIPFGIIAAELTGKPFLFVREKPKGHGKMKQVEGIPVTNKSAAVALIDPVHMSVTPYLKEALKALQGVGLKKITTCQPMISKFMHKVTVNGKRIVGMEDLVSTGESSLEQIRDMMQEGAIVFPRSVFSYDLPSAVENFEGYGLLNKSIVTFGELIEEYKRQDKLPSADEEELMNWYHNQPTWEDQWFAKQEK